MGSSYRDKSKSDWFRTDDSNPTLEQLQFGALQRIADACELMAKDHEQLVRECDRYKQWYERERATCARLNRSNAALRGVIGKLKKRIAELESEGGA